MSPAPRYLVFTLLIALGLFGAESASAQALSTYQLELAGEWSWPWDDSRDFVSKYAPTPSRDLVSRLAAEQGFKVASVEHAGVEIRQKAAGTRTLYSGRRIVRVTLAPAGRGASADRTTEMEQLEREIRSEQARAILTSLAPRADDVLKALTRNMPRLGSVLRGTTAVLKYEAAWKQVRLRVERLKSILDDAQGRATDSFTAIADQAIDDINLAYDGAAQTSLAIPAEVRELLDLPESPEEARAYADELAKGGHPQEALSWLRDLQRSDARGLDERIESLGRLAANLEPIASKPTTSTAHPKPTAPKAAPAKPAATAEEPTSTVSISEMTVRGQSFKVIHELDSKYLGSWEAKHQSGRLTLRADGTGSRWLDSPNYQRALRWGVRVNDEGEPIVEEKGGTRRLVLLLLLENGEIDNCTPYVATDGAVWISPSYHPR